MLNAFRSIFKNRNFTKLFLANFTSQMGSIIGITAFMYYLLDRYSNKPIYATLAELMYALPTLTVFFLVGVLADRMNRQKIASNSDLICALLSLGLMGAIWLNVLWLVFAILFLRSAVIKFFQPAEGAIVQGILSKDEYSTSAGLNQMMSSMFMLFGNALAIFIYWFIGIEGAVLLDLLTYVVSAVLIWNLELTAEVKLPNGKHSIKDLNIRMVLKDFKEGFEYIWKNELLKSLLFGFFICGIVNGGLSVMPAYIMKYKLASTHYEQMMIWLGIVFGSSVLMGSVVGSVIAQKMQHYQIITSGLALSGFFLAFSALPSSIWLFFVLCGLAGLSIPLVNIGIGGWMPKIVDPKMMGRVQGWITPLMMLSQTVTLGLIAAFYPAFITINGLFWTVGGCLVLVAVYYLFSLPKYERKDQPAEEQAQASSPATIS